MIAGNVCRTCHAEIVWAWTRNGSRIPLDVDPVPGGNLTVDTSSGGPVVTYVDADPAVVRHVSHYATCPDAAEHRHANRRTRR
jgi:hypothetical protein